MEGKNAIDVKIVTMCQHDSSLEMLTSSTLAPPGATSAYHKIKEYVSVHTFLLDPGICDLAHSITLSMGNQYAHYQLLHDDQFTADYCD